MRQPNPNLCPGDAGIRWDAAQTPAVPAPVTARCELITPMYGGGVEAGKVDRRLPVRPGALRGQLRFWWRLLNGSGQTAQDVFGAESALWGGISGKGPQASQVALRVKAEPVEDRQLAKKSKADFPVYALILEPGKDPDLLRLGYKFELTLHFTRKVTPPQRDQVIEALRWWASFAGVGARTRRGLGAVRVTGDEAELKPVSAAEVESRGGRMVLRTQTGSDAVKAWKEAVGALKTFRQGPGVGRNPGRGNRPGRSRWPEPDTIRRRTRRHAPAHAPQHPVDGYSPRAAFGLPIAFHFKDGGDPEDRTLTPAGHDRMASPLILRPYFDGKQYRPLALLLPGWEKRVSVKVGFDSESAKSAWPEDDAERRQRAAQIEPMCGRGDDPLSAFMHYFENG